MAVRQRILLMEPTARRVDSLLLARTSGWEEVTVVRAVFRRGHPPVQRLCLLCFLGVSVPQEQEHPQELQLALLQGVLAGLRAGAAGAGMCQLQRRLMRLETGGLRCTFISCLAGRRVLRAALTVRTA